MNWYLDVYATLGAAEAAKGPHGTVMESLRKVWLLSIKKLAGDQLAANGC